MTSPRTSVNALSTRLLHAGRRRTRLAVTVLLASALLVPPTLVSGGAAAGTGAGVGSGADAAQEVAATRWPGGSSVRIVDRAAYYGTDVSGLHLKVGATPAGDVLWAVDDREGLLLRLIQKDGLWVRDASNGWSTGKRITFPDGQRPDAEGVVVVDGWAYVATERDGSGAPRSSVIRVPTSGTATALQADREWALNSDFPGLGANVGFEAITFVPDTFLVGGAFKDERTGAAYDPADYPDRVGGGLFLVAAEAASTRGTVHAYALGRNGSTTRVASIANPLGLVMDLEFDRSTGTLWMACDDDCAGKVAVATLHGNADGRTTSFVAADVYARPSGLPDHNNEGFTVAPTSRCSGGVRPVLWSNDANDGSHVLRRGTLTCSGTTPPVPAPQPVAASVTVAPGSVPAGRQALLDVTVRASGVVPDGDVHVEVGTKRVSGSLVDGRVRVRVPAFSVVGRRTVTVRYAGDAETRAATATTTLDVTRALSRFTVAKPSVKVSSGKRARLVAHLHTDGVKAPGRIGVRIDGRRVEARLVRRGTKVVVRTPVLRGKGLRRVSVRYAGSRSTRPVRVVFKVRVR